MNSRGCKGGCTRLRPAGEWGFKPPAPGREEGESLFGKMGTVTEATKAVSKR
jgi:hypothetical protein